MPTEAAPRWLLVVSAFLRAARRGQRRLYHGCWLGHSSDLLVRPENGVIDYECPRCSLIVHTVIPLPPNVRPWNENAYRAAYAARNNEQQDKVVEGKFR